MCLLGHVLIVSLPILCKDGSFLCYRGMFRDMDIPFVVLPYSVGASIVNELHSQCLGLREKSVIKAHVSFPSSSKKIVW